MGRPTYPTALRVTPERITTYLAERDAACHRCGYSLRGLEKPRCPECGEWTPLTRRVLAAHLKPVEHRIHEWGVLDGYLVWAIGDQLFKAIPGDEIDEISYASWRANHIRSAVFWIGMAIGVIGLLFSAGVMIFVGVEGGLVGYVLFSDLCIVASIVSFFLCGWVVRDEVVVRHAQGEDRIPVGAMSRKAAERAIEQWRRARPAAEPEEEARCRIQAARRRIEAGICPRCGYSLDGPRVMVRVRRSESTGCLVSLCVGLVMPALAAFMVTVVWDVDADACCGVAPFVSAAVCVGTWWAWTRSRLMKPATPDWPGPGSCAACGWRPSERAGEGRGDDDDAERAHTARGEDKV
jgi:hypothetical protein